MNPHQGQLFAHDLAALRNSVSAPYLLASLRGIEKESLRVTADGALALTQHPRTLGSALTHPSLTTDYSEALLELITPPEHDAATALRRLDELHRYAFACLGDEMLWTGSMPCGLPGDEQIPIADYGTSRLGQMKTIYRRGLSYRYGRKMQCIAGIHYNYSLHDEVWKALHEQKDACGSLADYKSARYFSLIRNFRRTSWLLLYLFGASPAIDKRFPHDRAQGFAALDEDTHYLPYATSLRMSNIGYTNASAQSALTLDYRTLAEYLQVLSRALNTPHPPYEAIGTHRRDERIQLNVNVLQLEAEFYSTIRPKRVAAPGESLLNALEARGVQYIEARCLDIDPFEPNGISSTTASFMDAYLLTCLLDDSPEFTLDSHREAIGNFGRVATTGRQPGLTLSSDGTARPMTDMAHSILEKVHAVAALLDAIDGGDRHAHAVAAQQRKLDHPDSTPSARVVQAMRDQQLSHVRFVQTQSMAHAAHFRSRPLDENAMRAFLTLAGRSWQEQLDLERREREAVALDEGDRERMDLSTAVS